MGQLLLLPGRDQPTLHAVAHDAAVALDPAGHDGLPRRHGLQQHDAEALPARGWGAEDVGGLVVARQLLAGDAAHQFHVVEVALADDAQALLARVAGPHHDEAQVGVVPLETAVGLQKVPETLAPLKPAHEEEVDLAIPVLLQGREGLREAVVVDAVGDDLVVAGEELADVVHGRLGDGDAAVQLAEPPAAHVPPEPVDPVAAEGVKGADVDGIGAVEHRDGQGGSHGLVDVDDVELLPYQQGPDPGLKPHGEGDSGDGAAGGNGHRAPQGDQAVVDLLVPGLGEGGQDLHPVTHGRQLTAQIGHVVGDAAGIGEVVGRD